MIDWAHSDDVARWVVRRIPHMAQDIEAIRPFVAAGVLVGGMPAAGVIFQNFMPMYRSIEISCAAENPRWASRGHLAELLTYAFVANDCERITLLIPARNRRARRFNEGIGFVSEGTVRRGFGGDDAIIYGMLRDDAARWLKRS